MAGQISSKGISVIPKFGFGTVESVTISGGVAAVTKSYIKLAAETSTTDDCTQITGLDVGDIAIITADTGDSITMKDGANMIIGGDTALVGNNGDVIFVLCHDSGKVKEIAAWAYN